MKCLLRAHTVLICILMTLGPIGASEPARVEGTFRPAGPPQEPSRTAIGDRCVVDLVQEYALDGTLDGSMTLDFRVFVDGPCGSPPGTFDEHWIALGEYAVERAGEEAGEKRAGPVVYTADVEAGGRVAGELVLAESVRGTLRVRGSFEAGFMEYAGRIDDPTK